MEASEVRVLDEWVGRQSEDLLDLASRCARGGDASWDARLNQLGVTALPQKTRAEHLREGMRQTRGALPLEVRWALQSLADLVLERCDQLHGQHPAADGLTLLRNRCHHLVEEGMKRHLDAVRPGTGLTGIFANAKSTTMWPLQATRSEITIHTCPTCGGARHDESHTQACRYCGGAIIPQTRG